MTSEQLIALKTKLKKEGKYKGALDDTLDPAIIQFVFNEYSALKETGAKNMPDGLAKAPAASEQISGLASDLAGAAKDLLKGDAAKTAVQLSDPIRQKVEEKRISTTAVSDLYKDPRTGGHSDKDWREMFGNRDTRQGDAVIRDGKQIGELGGFVTTGAGRQMWTDSQSGPRLVSAPMGADEALARTLGTDWNRREGDTFETLAARRGELLRSNIRQTYGTRRPEAWSQGREAVKFALPGQGIVRETATGYLRTPEDNPMSQWMDINKSRYDDTINKRADGQRTSAFVPTRVPRYPGT